MRFVKKFLNPVFCGCVMSLVAMFLFCPAQTLQAEETDIVDTLEKDEAFLYVGDLITLKVYSLTRIALSTPGIVDIVQADEEEILFIGRKTGKTPLFIWDEYGKRKVTIQVITKDLSLIKNRVQTLLDAANIKNVMLKENYYEEKLIASGTITKHQEEKFEQIIDNFKDIVYDLTATEEALVQIDVQITELSTTLSKVLGFAWGTGEITGLALAYPETLPTLNGSDDWFKLGKFNRANEITATVNALITEGKGRVLSKPSIIVKDGEAATFLVGGEIPITQVTTSTEGSSITQNVTYSSYGIDVSVTPTIKNEKIDVDLNVSIRDVDISNAVGDNVAFTTRTATTKLFLNPEQTVVLAGLIKQNTGETVQRVPFLSKIPVVGMLFRSKTVPDSEVEVVISLTPRIIKQRDEKEINALKEKAEEAALEEQVFSSEELEGELWEIEELLIQDTEQEKIPDEVHEEAVKENLEETIEEIVEEKTETPPPEEEVLLQEEPPVEDAFWLGTAEAAEPELEVAPGREEQGSPTSNYVKEVQERISESISFPFEAKEEGWEGTVMLSLVILSDGTVLDAAVKESSGHEVFDKDAVNTAHILSPFDTFSVDIDLEEIVVTLPIVYSQEAVLGQSL